jgi:hypothetical protein
VRGVAALKAVTLVVVVIIGATGTILKAFRKYLSNTPGKHSIKELRKSAILGTAHTHTHTYTNTHTHTHTHTADTINSLNAELNLICHLLAFLGAHHILHVSRIGVNVQYSTGHSTMERTLHVA